jgi:hypothetical protein
VFYSFLFLCLLYLTFALSVGDFRLAGVSVDGGAKDSGHQEVCTGKSPSSQEPPANPENATPPPPAHETSMLDIALMSGRTGIFNHDVVCNLLAECLQDVSSTMFAMPYLFVCYWVFNISLFLY